MEIITVFFILLNIVTVAFGQASNCPSGYGNQDICYSVSVPSASASSGSGDIFFQIKGPSSQSWIALGQGTSMSGSNMFVVYANSAGDNVTLSPRAGKGQFEPEHDSSIQATLLSGSGISNGVMTANVKCSNCNSWNGGSMSFTDSSSNWIYASSSGSSVSSDSQSADISMHDENGNIQFDLTKATSSSSSNPTNPFAPSSSTSTSPSSPSSSPYSSSGNGNGNSNPGNSGSSSTSGPPTTGSFATFVSARTAHASLMSLAFLLFFPLGALLIRLSTHPSTLILHISIQIFSYALAIAGLGLGIWMAQFVHLLDNYHSIIGLVVVCVLVFQAPLGTLHHRWYKKEGRRGLWREAHVWLGRALLVLGTINGGLGLRLSANSREGEIAYGVFAGVIYVAYFIVVVAGVGRRGAQGRRKEERKVGRMIEKRRPGSGSPASGSV